MENSREYEKGRSRCSREFSFESVAVKSTKFSGSSKVQANPPFEFGACILLTVHTVSPSNAPLSPGVKPCQRLPNLPGKGACYSSSPLMNVPHQHIIHFAHRNTK